MDSIGKIKKKILKERGLGSFEKGTRKLVSIEDMPSPFKKTAAMKLVELKNNKKLEDLLFDGTIYKVGAKLGIDPTTVSKWRKIVSEAKEKEFWDNFRDVTPIDVGKGSFLDLPEINKEEPV